MGTKYSAINHECVTNTLLASVEYRKDQIDRWKHAWMVESRPSFGGFISLWIRSNAPPPGRVADGGHGRACRVRVLQEAASSTDAAPASTDLRAPVSLTHSVDRLSANVIPPTERGLTQTEGLAKAIYSLPTSRKGVDTPDALIAFSNDVALQRKVVCTPNLRHDTMLSAFITLSDGDLVS